MIEKDIKQIKEEDLQALITNRILEGKTIEYKKTLPGNSDADKKEFLADVSSFANATGGDLIYGISEDETTGTPREVKGLDINNISQELTRLDSIVRSGIDPRIPAVIIHPIELTSGKYVILIRIQTSWIRPHRVIFSGHNNFYSRSTNGKYPLDVIELRNAFILSEAVAEKIRKFREERIFKVISNDTPIPLRDNPKTILHIMPVISSRPIQQYPLNKIADTGKLKPMAFAMPGWNAKYNIDGYLSSSLLSPDGKSDSYVLVFRNGVIEAAEGSMLEPNSGVKRIFIDEYEETIINAVSNYLAILKTIDVEMPMFIFLTLIDVKNYWLASQTRRLLLTQNHVVDRNILYLPEVQIENYDLNPATVLKPCFDALWNACGFERSFNYDVNGRRLSR